MKMSFRIKTKKQNVQQNIHPKLCITSVSKMCKKKYISTKKIFMCIKSVSHIAVECPLRGASRLRARIYIYVKNWEFFEKTKKNP